MELLISPNDLSLINVVFLKEFHNRQTNAIGETLTIGSLYVPVPGFTRPVLILNGKQDFFYCQGDCDKNGGITTQALNIFYPNAANSSKAITIPAIGHNINLHLRRFDAFTAMTNFIKEVGIKP